MSEFRKLERTAIEITTHKDAAEADAAYWRSLTPIQRLEALEELRRLNYGEDDYPPRLSRVLEVVKRERR